MTFEFDTGEDEEESSIELIQSGEVVATVDHVSYSSEPPDPYSTGPGYSGTITTLSSDTDLETLSELATGAIADSWFDVKIEQVHSDGERLVTTLRRCYIMESHTHAGVESIPEVEMDIYVTEVEHTNHKQ